MVHLYTDKILLIANNKPVDHMNELKKVLQKLVKDGLKVNA